MCVSVCTLLWTTHRPKASLGEAWTWINYGPCMRWFCGRLGGWGWGCYTCELRHCKPQASSLTWSGKYVGQGENDSQLSPLQP